jgi:uncharacterized protein
MLIVDSHVHVLPPDPDGGDAIRDPYEIWEYGDKEGVEVLDTAGTLDEVTAAMTTADCDHFVAVNLFVAEHEVARVPSGAGADALRQRLKDFNAWIVDLAAHRSDMTAFVAADPGVLGGVAGADHLAWAADRGARGIKVHPIAQRFLPSDPGMDAIFAACEEMALGVIAHAGAARAIQWAEPVAYAAVLDRHPHLNLVLAHLGGALWRQAAPLAAAFPGISFDLCEIIAWVDAPGAPTRRQLAEAILEVGPERILFGTDFPWYDVSRTVDQVMDLPLLSEEQKEGILGRNAVRILGLDLNS